MPEDHPRRCGENLLMWLARGRQQGSPPQVRGKRHRSRWCRLKTRITPAGAGKIRQDGDRRTCSVDHPRRCGENVQQNFGMAGKLGSPPQVRGKPSGKSISAHARRITPAGAGKTQWSRRGASMRKDHPRRCGENAVLEELGLAYDGSPPQVRGKPGRSECPPSGLRITPAGAGKTMCVTIRTKTPQDHPRRCGENHLTWLAQVRRQGSPPQVRGKPFCGVATFVFFGITPAGAGKTKTKTDIIVQSEDHPRRCGENS